MRRFRKLNHFFLIILIVFEVLKRNNIHPKSQHLLTIKVNGRYYKFKVLPFGISIAPLVCQYMLNAILRFVRQYTKFTWGHIDDIIIRNEEPTLLEYIDFPYGFGEMDVP